MIKVIFPDQEKHLDISSMAWFLFLLCSPTHCEISLVHNPAPTNCTLDIKYLLNDFDFAFIVDRQRLSLETKTAFTVEFYGEDISEGLKAEMCILFFC